MCRSVEQEDSPLLFEDSEAADVQESGQGDCQRQPGLWVDKYSPRHFTDLLSDDVSSQ